MREILFRGKRTDNGEWVYGLLTDVENFVGFSEMNNTNGETGIYVNKNTVGQFTGLTDKDGTKIFEGDIVKHHRELWGKDDSDVGVVFWNAEECMFLRTSTKEDEHAQIWHNTEKSYEVIGNIHDNPELLGGEHK